ncbi:DUF3800 domain-containing protein [Telluribacter sp.]|jgi:hypothetical protein|uniref:DUF3800 domain-containing protein n=1 Tax=Telluribacter sp. TaxID=1978767 RepID=UPI002E1114E5|nr:DUF3800 domain-containing protein [Telluribacter sp.]
MPKQTALFIDESGDPEFYGHRKKLLVGTQGFQPLLILGMVETSDRKALYEAVTSLHSLVLSDSRLNSIYSVARPDWFFHSRTDHPDVRSRFFEMLGTLSSADLRFHAVIGRKDLQIFNRKHNNNPSEFYFDLVSHLLHGKLRVEEQYAIYLASRAKTTLHQLTDSVERAIESDAQKQGFFGQTIHYTCSIEPSKQMPELCVVDYFLWALQRYLLKGELHFWNTVEFLSGNVLDLYGELPNEYNSTNNLLRLDNMKPPLNL